MIRRLVKMTFKDGNSGEFLRIFNENKNAIANSEGCKSLQLLRSETNPNEFTTDSIWEGEEYLEKYRQSELFKNVWGKAKPLFAQKAEAQTIVL